ncbi:hypothetical protein DSBG_2728 [Desulfosporosinus sp. BG]|nr:hypothetical protein DSBG_2728 [Desulfosporosinus sp. BG]
MTQTGRLSHERCPKTLSSHVLAFLQDGKAPSMARRVLPESMER